MPRLEQPPKSLAMMTDEMASRYDTLQARAKSAEAQLDMLQEERQTLFEALELLQEKIESTVREIEESRRLMLEIVEVSRRREAKSGKKKETLNRMLCGKVEAERAPLTQRTPLGSLQTQEFDSTPALTPDSSLGDVPLHLEDLVSLTSCSLDDPKPSSSPWLRVTVPYRVTREGTRRLDIDRSENYTILPEATKRDIQYTIQQLTLEVPSRQEVRVPNYNITLIVDVQPEEGQQ
jgi:hypothetical protein